MIVKCFKCNKSVDKVRIGSIRCSCGNWLVADSNNETIKEFLRLKWYNLHLYPYTFTWNEKNAQRWLYEWLMDLQQFTCCHQDFVNIISKTKPDFSSADGFFAWGVDRHNDVNQKLGKPIMSLEEAKKVYNIMSPS